MSTSRKQRLWIAVAIVLLAIVVSTVWLAAQVALWARGLPGRIHVQPQGTSLSQFFAESFRGGLSSGDVPTKLQLLRGLQDGMRDKPEFAGWVRQELYQEVNELTGHPDAQVAEAAGQIIRELDAVGQPSILTPPGGSIP